MILYLKQRVKMDLVGATGVGYGEVVKISTDEYSIHWDRVENWDDAKLGKFEPSTYHHYPIHEFGVEHVFPDDSAPVTQRSRVSGIAPSHCSGCGERNAYDAPANYGDKLYCGQCRAFRL